MAVLLKQYIFDPILVTPKCAKVCFRGCSFLEIVNKQLKNLNKRACFQIPNDGYFVTFFTFF